MGQVLSYKLQKNRGTSLLDVMIGIALIALIFWGLVGAFILAINLVTSAKAKSGALSLAVEQLEYVRSLAYDDVATVGGIPAGSIPQLESISLNGVDYTRRTFVQFVDAPEDGLAGDDQNGITADYKDVKVELSWSIRGDSRSLALNSTVVPKGIETTAGGGTLIVNVIDALGAPVEGASVQVVNNSTNPTIDVTTVSNTSGQIIFPGSPEANSYELMITKAGHSSAQTYTADATNVAPSPGHLSILAGQVSEVTFAIDLVAQKTIETYEWLAQNAFTDTFSNELSLEELTQAQVTGGSVTLAVDPVSAEYYSSGSARSIAVAPTFLGGWLEFSWVDSTPANTDIVYQLFYESSPSVWSLVPDSALAGNSTGFGTSPVDLSGLDIGAYPALKLQASLSTTDTLVSPELNEWELSYEETTPLPAVDFTMRGTKVIGENSSGDAIYKYDVALSTDGNATLTLPNLEWDTYTISVDGATLGYDIRESCLLAQPRAINPGVATTTTLYFVPHTTHALHVNIIDTSGDVVPGASVNLKRTGYNETEESSSCGQAFFSGLTSASNYILTVTATGYQNNVTGSLDVTDYTDIEVVLTPQ